MSQEVDANGNTRTPRREKEVESEERKESHEAKVFLNVHVDNDRIPGGADTYDDGNDAEMKDSSFNVSFVPNRTAFRLKKNTNGNVLSVHHTVREQNRIIRIRLGACCFSENSKFVVIDKRGNVFVFDMIAKRFWKLSLVVSRANIIVPHKIRENEFIIGTKTGQLLLLDIEHSKALRGCSVSEQPIYEISFPEQTLPKRSMLVHAGSEAIMVNMNELTPTHRLDFDEGRMSLKFACYVPYTEQIFTCFTNDTVHIWSSASLRTVQITHPIKARDRKLRSMETDNLPVFRLGDDEDDNDHVIETCEVQNFSEGLIGTYCFSPNSVGPLCLATMDKYLLLLNPRSFELKQVIRLHDFVIQKCAILPQQNQILIAALTSGGKVLILDCHNMELKLTIHNSATNIKVSNDGKLLAVVGKCGEADVWKSNCLYNTLVSQQRCMEVLKEAFKQPKPLTFTSNECFNEDIKKLLQRDRLLAILNEYGFYPHKYRTLIWCSLLKLPCNRVKFQELLKLSTPLSVKRRVESLKIRNEVHKRALMKIWSCLSNWCKVFAYSDFFPHLIFPFVKVFPKNAIVNFEIIATLVLNHFQLWFEFHPLPPADYLGMCENILQHFDPDLWEFYVKFELKGKEFAWPILSTSFAEVLDDEQWLILWDHIVSCPLEFIIFCVVAYNILQREVIMLLPDKIAVEHFFHERNPISIQKLVQKSFALMKKCPAERNPERYFELFKPIPKNVYPKFLRYPREWLVKQEDELLALQREQEAIEERMRQLELNESKIMNELEDGLKKEEHAKRLKEMESLYHDAIKREEERVACQRKLLCLYQKEIRGCKGQVIATLRESERRKHAIEMETQMERLMHTIERERRRNDSNMILVEDELKNQNFEVLAQRYCLEQHTYNPNLSMKFRKDLLQLTEEGNRLRQHMEELQGAKTIITSNEKQDFNNRHSLSEIERKLQDIQKEFMYITKRN